MSTIFFSADPKNQERGLDQKRRGLVILWRTQKIDKTAMEKLWV